MGEGVKAPQVRQHDLWRWLKPIRDAMTGQVLDRNLIMVARQKELSYFLAKEVWMKRPRSEAYRNTGKRPISVKWVDVSEGSDERPTYPPRLLAGEVRRALGVNRFLLYWEQLCSALLTNENIIMLDKVKKKLHSFTYLRLHRS